MSPLLIRVRRPSLALLTCVIYGIGQAAPSQPANDFQTELNGTPRLQFRGNAWYLNGGQVFNAAPALVDENSLSYATVELYGSHLQRSTIVEFVGSNLSIVEDRITLPAGDSPETFRTIPLTDKTIRVRVVDGTSVGAGRVVVGRVFVPYSPSATAEAISVGMTALADLVDAPSPETRQLVESARGVAFLQIAEPNATNSCTGFLVKENIVATAAHCLLTAKAAEEPGSWRTTICRRIAVVFDFRSALRGPEPLNSAHCVMVVYFDENPNEVLTSGGKASVVARNDIALLKIDPTPTAANGSRTRPVVALSEKEASAVVSVVQHPQGDVAYVASQCKARKVPNEHLLMHSCSTAPGSSGSPIFAYGGSGWVTLGMHTCCAQQPAVSSDSVASFKAALGVLNFGVPAALISAALAENTKPTPP